MQDLSKYTDEAVALRRRIHRRPEEGWTEFETTYLVTQTLENLGYSVRLGTDIIDPEHALGRDPELVQKAIARALKAGVPQSFIDRTKGFTGAVAELDTGRPGPVTGFRFDMDCVLVDESTESCHVPAANGFASEIPGAMHACGHDGHTASGLALAHWLKDNQDKLCGRIRLVFQPAEEGTRGAAAMAAAGVVDDCNWFFGAHVGSGCGPNEIGIVHKGFLATTKLDISFTGQPSHAGSEPHKGKSALMAAAACALMMAGIPRHGEGDSRVAVGRLVAGEGRNVTPVHAYMQAEVRGETAEVNDYMTQNVEQIAKGVAAAYGVEVKIVKVGEATSLVSSPDASMVLLKAAEAIPGVKVTEFDNGTGSEDCSMLIRRVQEKGGKGGFFFYGCKHNGHHRSDFEIQDTESLPLALKEMVNVLAITNAAR